MTTKPKLTFRAYRKEDNDACELLEKRANQFRNEKYQHLPIIGRLIKRLQEDSIEVHLRHPQGFDARAKTAEDYEIVVCEDESSRVIAVVLVNIRTVLWSGAPIKAGWLYGLRVDEAYQRMGIGRELSEVLEQRCVEKGVSMLYFTVNDENEKAKSFYRTIGFQQASQRWQATRFLTSEEKLPSDLVVIQLTPETEAYLHCMHHSIKDLSLSTKEAYVELFTSSDCEGTLLAILRSDVPLDCIPLLGEGYTEELRTALDDAICNGDVQSYAGVSLWNASALKSLEVVRLGFGKETWLSLPFQATLLTAMVTPLAFWGSKLLGRIISASRSHGLLGCGRTEDCSYWRTGYLLGETLCMLITSRLAWRAAKFFRFIVTRDSHRLATKAFAPFRHGPKGLQCLDGALAASRNEARRKGYGVWFLNVSDKHSDKEYFPKSGFYTQWMQKWLQDAPNPQQWTEFSPNAFCDPRNL